MTDARKKAEEALAAIDAAIGDADETTPERVSLAALGPALCDLIRATRALLAAAPAPPAGAAVREAAEAVCERLCGGAGEGYYRKVAPGLVADIEALRAALRANASPAPGSEGVREAVSENDVYTLIGHAEYLRKVRGEEDMPKFFDDLARRLLAALRGGQKGEGQ